MSLLAWVDVVGGARRGEAARMLFKLAASPGYILLR